VDAAVALGEVEVNLLRIIDGLESPEVDGGR